MYSLESGPVINVITALLDPDPIYKAMIILAGASTVVFWLFPLFFAIRIFRESHGLSLNASIGKALGESVGSIKGFLIYTVAGLFFFSLLFNLAELFSNMGSLGHIEKSLAEFRIAMMNKPEQEKDWIETLLSFAADIGNGLTAPLFYLLYTVISLLYVFVKHLLDMVFALLLALVYVWGFVAIASQALPNSMKLMDGFIKSFMALAVWAIIEPIAMGLIWIIAQPAEAKLVAIYGGGLGTTAMNVWSVYASLLLVVVIVVLIVLPFAAQRLANNQGMVDTFAAGVAATTALAGNQLLGFVKDKASQSAGGINNMMPSDDGSRRRDGMGQAVSDKVGAVMSSDIISGIGSVGAAAASGLGNLLNNGASEGASTDDGDSGGDPISDGMGSAQTDNQRSSESNTPSGDSSAPSQNENSDNRGDNDSNTSSNNSGGGNTQTENNTSSMEGMGDLNQTAQSDSTEGDHNSTSTQSESSNIDTNQSSDQPKDSMGDVRESIQSPTGQESEPKGEGDNQPSFDESHYALLDNEFNGRNESLGDVADLPDTDDKHRPDPSPNGNDDESRS